MIPVILPSKEIFVGEIEDQDEKIEVHCREGLKLARKILSELKVEPSVVDRVSYPVGRCTTELIQVMKTSNSCLKQKV